MINYLSLDIKIYNNKLNKKNEQFIRDRTIFDQYVAEILKSLMENDLKKSKVYMEKI